MQSLKGDPLAVEDIQGVIAQSMTGALTMAMVYCGDRLVGARAAPASEDAWACSLARFPAHITPTQGGRPLNIRKSIQD